MMHSSLTSVSASGLACDTAFRLDGADRFCSRLAPTLPGLQSTIGRDVQSAWAPEPYRHQPAAASAALKSRNGTQIYLRLRNESARQCWQTLLTPVVCMTGSATTVIARQPQGEAKDLVLLDKIPSY